MPNIKGRWTLFRMSIERVLRVGLRDRTGCSEAAGDRACVIERLAPGVTGRKAGSAAANVSGERALKRVIGGMRGGRDEALEPKAADRHTRRIKPRMTGKLRPCAGISIRKTGSRQLYSRRSNIVQISCQGSKGPFQTCSPGIKGAVAERSIDSAKAKRTHRMAWGKSGNVVLIAINIHDCVGCYILCIATRKDIYASRCIG